MISRLTFHISKAAGAQRPRRPVRAASVTFVISGVLVLAGCFLATDNAHRGERFQSGACTTGPCLRVSIDPLPELGAGISAGARSEIERAIGGVLFAPVDQGEGVGDPARVVSELSEVFEGELAKEAGEPPRWSLIRSASVLYRNERLITVDVRSEGYLGGAHGFDERSLFTFDLSDGHKLSLDEILGDKERGTFQTIAEHEFRRVRNVPIGTPLREAGFSFPNEAAFSLPENFGVTEEGIVLHYNPYEVAPYSLGATEVVVPAQAVAPLMQSGAPHLAHLFDGKAPSS